MRPVIEMPSVVAVLRTWLIDQLPAFGWPSTPVVGSVPNPRPQRFVMLQRTGGVMASVVTDLAQVTVECWGSSDEESEDLALTVRGLLASLHSDVIDGTTVYGVTEFSGPAFLPDPESKQSRTTWTVQAHVRGDAVDLSSS